MIDLHTHTTCSDGTDSPLALVKKAASSGITVLGVTDHDSTSGWAEATAALHGGLKLALGAEVSCLTEDGISVHMLGLLFDGEHKEMQQMLEDSRDTRIPRMRKMIELDSPTLTQVVPELGQPELGCGTILTVLRLLAVVTDAAETPSGIFLGQVMSPRWHICDNILVWLFRRSIGEADTFRSATGYYFFIGANLCQCQ